MKKLLPLLLLVIILIVGGYFGYNYWERGSLLKSGKVLVLVNEKEGFFTYSDFLEEGDIDRDYDIIGVYEEMTEEEINAATEGYSLRLSSIENPSDPRVPVLLDREVTTPNDEQRPAWLAITDSLPVAQKQVCDSINFADQVQQCYIQHHIFNSARSGGDSSLCEGIFLEDSKKDCIQILDGKIDQTSLDKNANSLIDTFELVNGNDEELRPLYEQFFTQ